MDTVMTSPEDKDLHLANSSAGGKNVAALHSTFLADSLAAGRKISIKKPALGARSISADVLPLRFPGVGLRYSDESNSVKLNKSRIELEASSHLNGITSPKRRRAQDHITPVDLQCDLMSTAADVISDEKAETAGRRILKNTTCSWDTIEDEQTLTNARCFSQVDTPGTLRKCRRKRSSFSHGPAQTGESSTPIRNLQHRLGTNPIATPKPFQAQSVSTSADLQQMPPPSYTPMRQERQPLLFSSPLCTREASNSRTGATLSAQKTACKTPHQATGFAVSRSPVAWTGAETSSRHIDYGIATTTKQQQLSSDKRSTYVFGANVGNSQAYEGLREPTSDLSRAMLPTTTPFRFTTFPASLPRVNNPRPIALSQTPRPTYPTVAVSYESPPTGSELRSSATAPSSHSEDTTQKCLNPAELNSITVNKSAQSIESGLYADTGVAQKTTAPLFKVHANTLQPWRFPANSCSDMHMLVHEFAVQGKDSGVVGTQLARGNFPANFNFHEAGDGSQLDSKSLDVNSPQNMNGELIGRTRLNFNSLLSPGLESKESINLRSGCFRKDDNESDTDEALSPKLNEHELIEPGFSHTDQHPIVLHTQAFLKTGTSSCSPFWFGADCRLMQNSNENQLTSPVMQSRRQMESTQYSLAEKYPEENYIDDANKKNGSPKSDTSITDPNATAPESSVPSYDDEGTECCSEAEDVTLLSHVGSVLPEHRRKSIADGSDTSTGNRESKWNVSLGGAASLNGSGDPNASDISANKSRKLRPMPDVAAFDLGGTSNGFASHSDSTDGANKSRDQMQCPPTPVRTPAWAHHENRGSVFQRANSLIASKVLAECPPQILNGLSSLEDSLLEDESNWGDDIDHNSKSLATSFCAVLEDNEVASIPDDNASSCKALHEEDGSLLSPLSSTTCTSAKHAAGCSVMSDLATNSSPVLSSESNSRQLKMRPSSVRAWNGEVGSPISFAADFENLGQLGSGTFADVFKVRLKSDQKVYAVKRNRRQFRGKRDRDRAMAEVRTMQRLQSIGVSGIDGSLGSSNNEKMRNTYCLYLLFFIRAWQEDGYFFCQTELCCRDTCRELMLSMSVDWNKMKTEYPSLEVNLPSSPQQDTVGRLIPEPSLWKICHDVSAGLSHIHSHNMVHYDIKPSNILFVLHTRLGILCKIGDFGMAGNIDTVDDGQEGDTVYMPPELLSSAAKHPSSDIFSLGLTLYELSSAGTWELPTEGPRWHEIRSGMHVPELPSARSSSLTCLVRKLIHPDKLKRPTADEILACHENVKKAGLTYDKFLSDYVRDVEEYDLKREKENVIANQEANQSFTPTGNVASRFVFERDAKRVGNIRTPTLGSGPGLHKMKSSH